MTELITFDLVGLTPRQRVTMARDGQSARRHCREVVNQVFLVIRPCYGVEK